MTQGLMTKEQVIEGLKNLREGKGIDEFDIINTAIVYLEEGGDTSLLSVVASIPTQENTASHIRD